MAFQLKQSLFELANALMINFWDSTGVYNASTNTTGYGAPNIESSAVTQAIITFKFDDIANPMVMTLTIASNVVTAGTFLDALGNTIDITDTLADYNISVFPFPQSSPIELPPILFQVSPLSYEDQYLTITYSITNGVDTYDSTQVWLLNANSCCCLAKGWRDWADGGCDIKRVTDIQNAMNGLNAQTAIGDIQAGRISIARLKKLCCDCGCGGGC
jgi:hypothetical protein